MGIRSLLSRRVPLEARINFLGRGRVSLIDVGSVGGIDPRWAQRAEHLRFLVCFEPREASSRSKHILSLQTALWDEDGDRDFYVYRGLNQSGSSLFRQNYDYVRTHYDTLQGQGPAALAKTWFERSELVETRRVGCRQLDGVLAEHAPGRRFDFLKIDAQGAEHQILRGAENTLRACTGLYLELFKIPLYEGITLMPDVVEHLDALQFDLVRKDQAHGSFDSQHNCLFLRRGSHGRVRETIEKVYEMSGNSAV